MNIQDRLKAIESSYNDSDLKKEQNSLDVKKEQHGCFTCRNYEHNDVKKYRDLYVGINVYLCDKCADRYPGKELIDHRYI